MHMSGIVVSLLKFVKDLRTIYEIGNVNGLS